MKTEQSNENEITSVADFLIELIGGMIIFVAPVVFTIYKMWA